MEGRRGVVFNNLPFIFLFVFTVWLAWAYQGQVPHSKLSWRRVTLVGQMWGHGAEGSVVADSWLCTLPAPGAAAFLGRLSRFAWRCLIF